MKNIKKYDEFCNEEISKKGLVKGMLAGTLAFGGIAGGAAYMRDRSSAPTEEISNIKKEIPNQFMINEKLLTIGNDFWITNDKRENFGKVEQRVLSWGKKFEYFDNTGKLDATAQEEVLTMSNKIHVEDANGNKIGRIEQEILESFENILDGQNVYSVYDKDGKLVAKSKADNFIKNDVDIYDNSGDLVARFHKPAMGFGDRWNCEVVKEEIDKRLLIFIPCYLSSSSSKSRNNKK